MQTFKPHRQVGEDGNVMNLHVLMPTFNNDPPVLMWIFLYPPTPNPDYFEAAIRHIIGDYLFELLSLRL